MRLFLFTMTLAFATPAAAQEERSGPDGSKTDVVCRAVAETGTRLGRKRICLTRDQWSEYRRVLKQELEQAQRIRSGPDGE